MKRYLTLFFLLITSIALCAYPEGAINNIDGSVLGWDDSNQVWRPIAIDENGKLSGSNNPTVASISVQVASISIKLDDIKTEDSITGYRSQRLSIAPETPTVLTPVVGSVGSKRVFIELRAVNETAVFYIGFGNGVTDSNGRPTKGRILINVPTSNQNITIYHNNESNLDIQQTEGWK